MNSKQEQLNKLMRLKLDALMAIRMARNRAKA